MTWDDLSSDPLGDVQAAIDKFRVIKICEGCHSRRAGPQIMNYCDPCAEEIERNRQHEENDNAQDL